MTRDQIVKLLKQRALLREQLDTVEASLSERGVEDVDLGERVEKLQKLVAYFEGLAEIVLHGDGVEVAIWKTRFIRALQEELEDAQQLLAAVEGGDQ